MKGTMEIISTEDGLARIDLFNKQQDEVLEQYTVPPDDGGGGKYTYRVSHKKLYLVWRVVAPLNFELGIKVGGVLESSGSQL